MDKATERVCQPSGRILDVTIGSNRSRLYTAANGVTLARLLLLFIVVALTYEQRVGLFYLNAFLLVLVFASDGLDGYIARRRDESTLFGAHFDIACDRIVELTLWVVFVDLNQVPFWVALVFIVRGTVVDSIRALDSRRHQRAPFSMMQSKWGRRLVSGSAMRIGYSFLKALTFIALMLLLGQRSQLQVPPHSIALLVNITTLLVNASVVVCVLRGLPVVAEFLVETRRSERSQADID